MKLKIFAAVALIALAAAACNKSSQNQNKDNSAPAAQQDQQNSSVSQNQPANPPIDQSQSANAPTGTHFSSPQENDVAPEPEVREVDITSSGFVPQSITIFQDDHIKFVNKDSAEHWPASNPHPTHTDLPGFDALHALSQGQSYTYQFTKVGTWGYHDHLNPSTMGTVVVQARP